MNTEVKSGYKQTEVGLIPEDWFVTSLGKSFGKITTGKLDANAMSANGEYPFFTCAKDVYRINDYAFDCDALLISGNGANVGYIHHYNGKFNAYQRTYVLTDAKHDIHYLKIYTGVNLQERLRVEVNAGNTPYIVKSTLSDMLIGLPNSSAEQQKIAFTLEDIDALISSLDQLIAKKRDIQQATMQQLLTGQRRLPGFSSEWEVRPFNSIFQRINVKGHQIQASDYQSTGKYPVVDQGKDLIVGFSDNEEKRFINTPKGVIVFGDHTCIVKFVDFDFLVGADGTQVLQAMEGQNTRFHAFQLQYRGIEPTGYNRHFKFLKERSFQEPPLDEQTAIATVLSDMEAELAALESRHDKAQQIKQGMMQELLTGRIRLA